MDQYRELQLMLPEPLRRFPADLTAVVGLVVLTLGAVFLPIVSDTPLRILFGLPFVLFLPGYAIIAALFPEAGEAPAEEADVPSGTGDDTDDAGGVIPSDVRDRGIDGIERVALSFGLSIAVVPLIGLVLNFTPWGIRLVPVALSIAAVTVGTSGIAALRRQQLPEDERFSVPYRSWYGTARSELFEPDSRADAALNVLLVASVLLAVSSVAYAVAVPPDGEQFSELYLLTENDDGELVADGYPTEMVQGESEPVVVGIGNQEHESTEYTVIVQLQRVETVDNETRVLERQQIGRLDTTLAHNETWHREHELTPTMTGEDLRVQYLLYRGEPPTDPTGANAYRTTHLWVDVAESESGAD